VPACLIFSNLLYLGRPNEVHDWQLTKKTVYDIQFTHSCTMLAVACSWKTIYKQNSQ